MVLFEAHQPRIIARFKITRFHVMRGVDATCMQESELIVLNCEILVEIHVCWGETVFHLAGALVPQPICTKGPIGL